jgi:2,4-dienoyl-CoA reductase-like NADH-dependent reductase (Old Yellow Enzyme family)
MRMPDVDIVETYTMLVKVLRERVPDLAYLHVIQPRIAGDQTAEVGSGDSDAFMRELWGAKRAYIAAGGFTRETATQRADASGDLVCFGRDFISNVSYVSRHIWDRADGGIAGSRQKAREEPAADGVQSCDVLHAWAGGLHRLPDHRGGVERGQVDLCTCRPLTARSLVQYLTQYVYPTVTVLPHPSW